MWYSTMYIQLMFLTEYLTILLEYIKIRPNIFYQFSK